MFKEFVTEKQIEEVKKKRQEEWEKVRRPDQPLGKYCMIGSLTRSPLWAMHKG